MLIYHLYKMSMALELGKVAHNTEDDEPSLFSSSGELPHNNFVHHHCIALGQGHDVFELFYLLEFIIDYITTF